jgi:hypothetical protein
MKKITVIFMLSGFLIFNLFSQECSFYYPKTKGAILEYKSYDKKNSLTGITRHQVKDIIQNGNSVSATIEVEAFDKKEKLLGTNEFTVRCEGGIYYVDMKNYMNTEALAAYKDMDVSIKSDNLEMPSTLKTGDQLNNGSLVITVSSSGVKMMTMTTNITNRKVEAKEKITTEAGTFDCFKISYDITVKMMMTMKLNAIEWYAKDVGMVKSESYSNGSLSGSTILTAIK